MYNFVSISKALLGQSEHFKITFERFKYEYTCSRTTLLCISEGQITIVSNKLSETCTNWVPFKFLLSPERTWNMETRNLHQKYRYNQHSKQSTLILNVRYVRNIMKYTYYNFSFVLEPLLEDRILMYDEIWNRRTSVNVSKFGGGE